MNKEIFVHRKPNEDIFYVYNAGTYALTYLITHIRRCRRGNGSTVFIEHTDGTKSRWAYLTEEQAVCVSAEEVIAIRLSTDDLATVSSGDYPP